MNQPKSSKIMNTNQIQGMLRDTKYNRNNNYRSNSNNINNQMKQSNNR